MQLRSYQQELSDKIDLSWSRGNRNVVAIAPTGAGKTVLFSHKIHTNRGSACAIAHRQELVGQMSLALAREQVKHRIIGPRNVISDIVKAHTDELGRSWYDPTAKDGVAGVDTLIRRTDQLAAWAPTVNLWVQDEGHHVLLDNKWGAACAMFPNARGLGVTATPSRADGKGLGRHADGVYDDLVEGPQMRWLIDNGFLTDYRIFAPHPSLIMDDDAIGSTGDYSQKKLKAASQKSKIVGDVVEHYRRIAPGKLGVVFATDVETSERIAQEFNDVGIPAATISADSKNRGDTIRKFRNRELTILVNVDIFGEGFDLPAIEVCIFARPTASFGLYIQQFGRALRLMNGKEWAIIIDHVGNVMKHGLPDRPRTWSLDRREKRGKSKDRDENPLKACTNPVCLSVYEAIYKACPHCGHIIEPQRRDGPEYVDGDLMELDPAYLAQLRGEIERIDAPAHELADRMRHAGAPQMAINGAAKNHRERQDAQAKLRDTIALWAGYQRRAGYSDSESYRKFYFKYGVDVATAQTLGKREAETLAGRIGGDLYELMV